MTSWDDVRKILGYAFHKGLKVAPENQSVLLAETPLNPKPNREGIAKILFEEFNVKEVSFVNDAVLALKNSGKSSG